MAKSIVNNNIYIGTAGWNIPKQLKSTFPKDGTHLQKYAQVFNAVEINSSFYKDHKPSSYAKWADSTPDHFRFSVKLSRYFTQEMRLQVSGVKLKETISGMSELKHKLGVLLVQLPPSLTFVPESVDSFLSELRGLFSGIIAWEPRHKTWAEEPALALLEKYEINKVHADPEVVPIEKEDQHRLQNDRYYRLHGSPKIYKSKYTDFALESLRNRIQQPVKSGRSSWVIFDNTTFGFATEDAIELMRKLSEASSGQELKNFPVQTDDIGLGLQNR